MTNEEAIKWLNVERQLIVEIPQDNSKELKEAYDMAIKALEQTELTPSYNSVKSELNPCEDCISREAVDALVDELARAISDERCCMSRGRSTATIMQDILDLPSVTPQPKTGRWIEIEVHNCHATLKCSECDRVIEPTYTFGMYSYEDIKEFYPYCHCGAKMESEE